MNPVLFRGGSVWWLLAGCWLCVTGSSLSQDAPHQFSSPCQVCHLTSYALGNQMGSVYGNANLCQSCHLTGGQASGTPLPDVCQANAWPGGPTNIAASGTSHRWDAGPAGRVVYVGTPRQNADWAVQAVGTYTGRYARTYQVTISTSGTVGTARFNWETISPAGGSKGTNVLTGIGVPIEDGLVLEFYNTVPGTAFQPGERWNVLVRPDLKWPANEELRSMLPANAMVCSTCHQVHSQEATPFDPSAPPSGAGRHFMRVDSPQDQLCFECHAARFVTNSTAGSHPVGISVATNAYYRPPTVLPVDGERSQVWCSTCHQVHNSPAANGTLLRVSSEKALCADCHKLADLTTPGRHLNPATGTVWPGGQYGSTFPAVSTPERGQCGNCHRVHGWPNAAATNDYASLLVEREENLCYTCHDGSPVTKNIRANFAKTYSHPVTLSGRHTNLEDGVPSRFGTTNRHSECVDCHNPHMAVNDTTTPLPPNASRTLKGVARVSVANLATNLIQYTYRSAADTTPAKEYEVCFLCHSSWTTQPTGQSNHAAKFNTLNASYHPVEALGKNQNILASAFTNGWSATRMVFCSDCHRSDDPTIRGPHASTNRFILRKPYTADTTTRVSQSTLCFECHSYSTYTSSSSTAKAGTRWRGRDDYNTHLHASKNCYGCHDTHGSADRPNMIITGRDLVSYTRTASGGTCVGRSGCHGSESYTVGYAR